jgi:hypothetical protein
LQRESPDFSYSRVRIKMALACVLYSTSFWRSLPMKTILFPISGLLAVCALLFLNSPFTAFAQSGQRTWNFDKDTPGKAPEGFTSALTGRGTMGQWVVTQEATAPSGPNVLAQTSQDKTDYRFPLAIAEGTSYKDVALSVKFKAISGTVDQGAGLIFRLRDKTIIMSSVRMLWKTTFASTAS